MLTVKELQPRIVELTMAGVVEASDIETAERALTPLLESRGKIGIVVRAEGLEDMTADAIAEDARFELGLPPRWAKVARLALVTDKQAFAAVMRWMDPILPMIAMRSFAPDEADAAVRWASDLPDDTATASPGIHILADGSDGVLAFEIDGTMTRADVDRVFEPFERLTAGGGKLSLLARFKDFEGFDPSLVLDRDVLASKFGALGHVDRYAVVGAPGWMGSVIGAMGPLLPLEMRSFAVADEAAAWDWAGAGRKAA